jgi:hypothetical protein
MSQAKVVQELVASDWDHGEPGSGFPKLRWLQQNVVDLLNRPKFNRVTGSTNATAITCNGAVQSSGVGTGQIRPLRYAEVTVKARVTFNVTSAGPAFIYVYRTTGTIPANGAAPNVGDVIVGGDSFMGGPTTSGVNQSGAFSFIDTGLDVTKSYRYYLAVKGPNTNTLNLINSSQIFVLERS